MDTTGPARKKDSSRKRKQEVAPPKKKLMPYREEDSKRAPRPPVLPGPGVTRGELGPVKPGIDDKIYRTMAINEQQLKQIKKAYGIK